jgi:hypothetical protein
MSTTCTVLAAVRHSAGPLRQVIHCSELLPWRQRLKSSRLRAPQTDKNAVRSCPNHVHMMNTYTLCRMHGRDAESRWGCSQTAHPSWPSSERERGESDSSNEI